MKNSLTEKPTHLISASLNAADRKGKRESALAIVRNDIAKTQTKIFSARSVPIRHTGQVNPPYSLLLQRWSGSLPETGKPLRKAGYALSHSSKFDIVPEYFIKKRIFDIYEINGVLCRFGMPLPGSGMNGKVASQATLSLWLLDILHLQG